jgi:lipopolysaccharide transport system permease protein
MFVSPVFYPSNVLPAKWRFVYLLNPLAGIIDGYRSSLFGQRIDWTALGISTLITLILLVYASYSFRRMERTFADVV